MEFRLDDLKGTEIQQFLSEHLQDMHSTAPRQYCHALDVSELQVASVRFWSQWLDDQLVGCAALKRLNEADAELKSMRVAPSYRGQGLSTALLAHVVDDARAQGFKRIKLETGTAPYFNAAVALYRKNGFMPCAAFSDYEASSHNQFMQKDL